MSGGQYEQILLYINGTQRQISSNQLSSAHPFACVGSSKADSFFGMILKALHGKLPTTMLALMILQPLSLLFGQVVLFHPRLLVRYFDGWLGIFRHCSCFRYRFGFESTTLYLPAARRCLYKQEGKGNIFKWMYVEMRWANFAIYKRHSDANQF